MRDVLAAAAGGASAGLTQMNVFVYFICGARAEPPDYSWEFNCHGRQALSVVVW